MSSSKKFPSISSVEKGVDLVDKGVMGAEALTGHAPIGAPGYLYNRATSGLIHKFAPIGAMNSPMMKRTMAGRSIGIALAGLFATAVYMRSHSSSVHKKSGE